MPLIHINTFTHNIYNRHKCTFMSTHMSHTYMHMRPHVHRDTCTHMYAHIHIPVTAKPLYQFSYTKAVAPGKDMLTLGPLLSAVRLLLCFNLYKKCP